MNIMFWDSGQSPLRRKKNGIWLPGVSDLSYEPHLSSFCCLSVLSSFLLPSSSPLSLEGARTLDELLVAQSENTEPMFFSL